MNVEQNQVLISTDRIDTMDEFISYIDEEGYRHLFHLPGTRIFRDGTFWCPHCGPRRLSSNHRKVLARYIENAEQETYVREFQ